jgi:hypothetical protein
LDIFHQAEFAKADWRGIKSKVEETDAIAPHLETLASAFGDLSTVAASIRLRNRLYRQMAHGQ